MIILHMDSDLVDYSEALDLIECVEGNLIDSYLFGLGKSQGVQDCRVLKEIIEDINFWKSEDEIKYHEPLELVEDYQYLYILEDYATEWSSNHKYILTNEYLEDHEDLFQQEEY